MPLKSPPLKKGDLGGFLNGIRNYPWPPFFKEGTPFVDTISRIEV
jgi:hypothetical protein